MHRISLSALLLLAMILPGDATWACTIFKITSGKKTLVGNNEDDNNPATKVWFLAPENGKHGRVLFGYSDGVAQGGMNDQGLFFDWVADNWNEEWKRDPKKLNYPGSVSEKILEEASTVEEALRFYELYNETAFLRSRTLLVDSSGASAIVAWKNGQLQVTRGTGKFQAMGYCEQGASVQLDKLTKIAIEPVRAILESCVQKGQYPTQYSNLYELNRREVYVYRFAENVGVKFVLKDELAKGHHYYDLPRLAEELKLPLMTDHKTQPVAKVNPSIYARYVGDYLIPPDYIMKISTKSGRLYFEAPDVSRTEIFPASCTRFFIRTLDAYMTFANDGKSDRVFLNVKGRETIGTRMSAADQSSAKQ